MTMSWDSESSPRQINGRSKHGDGMTADKAVVQKLMVVTPL